MLIILSKQLKVKTTSIHITKRRYYVKKIPYMDKHPFLSSIGLSIFLNIATYILFLLINLIFTREKVVFFGTLITIVVVFILFVVSDVIYVNQSTSKAAVLIWLFITPIILICCFMVYTPYNWFENGYTRDLVGNGHDHPIYYTVALFFERGSLLYSSAYNSVIIFLGRIIPFTIAKLCIFVDKKYQSNNLNSHECSESHTDMLSESPQLQKTTVDCTSDENSEENDTL